MDQEGLSAQIAMAERQGENPGIRVDGSFWCNEVQIGENFHRGEYLNNSNEWVTANFLSSVPSNLAERDRLLNMVPSENFRNVIKPKVTHTIQNSIIIGYEPFDDTFRSWINQNPIEAFTSDESDLHSWWKEATLDVIEAMDDIHEHKKFHGGMDNDNNYVIVGRKLRLINVGIGDGSTMNKEERKREDCRCFLTFLARHVVPIHNSRQWTDFIGSFEGDELKQSRITPMLLKSMKRNAYLRRIIDCYNNNLTGVYPNMAPTTEKQVFEDFLSVQAEGQLPYDWRVNLPNDPYLDYVYTQDLRGQLKNIPFQGNTLHLLYFLEAVIDHFGDKAKRNTVPRPNPGLRRDLEQKFSTCFPGYLTIIHRVLVRHFPTHNVTRLNL